MTKRQRRQFNQEQTLRMSQSQPEFDQVSVESKNIIVGKQKRS